MTDYIKREDAIKAFDPSQRRDWYTPWIVETLEDLPSADVEPVVRCKDCKYGRKSQHQDGNNPYWVCLNWDSGTDEDGYCHHGERRDDDKSCDTCKHYDKGWGDKMSYDVCFMVKVEAKDKWVEVGCCDANITWNLRDMIVAATGLEWENEENNGLCKDVIPAIKKGYNELQMYPDKYEKYESPNGWGTIGGCIRFFGEILEAWELFLIDHEDLVDVVTFWIW